MDAALNQSDATQALASARRLVVKIGSSLLTEPATGALKRDWLAALARDLAPYHARGVEILVVSSGAIALGGGVLGLINPRTRLSEAQAAAAVGQIALAHAYQEAFAAEGMSVAQLLLTISDLEDRRRYLNARSAVSTLLGLGAVPVINENDTVATSEIRFGDNDRLAARVAQMAGADVLILLSDVDGLYTADPTHNPDAEFIPVVEEITPEIRAMAGPSSLAGVGSGGMITKVAAARIAAGAGCATVLVDGTKSAPVSAFCRTGRGTLFKAKLTPMQARKAWIRGLMAAGGSVTVDDGAVAALKDGNSLLAVGIAHVDGAFEPGDLVTVRAMSGADVAQGLVAYSADDCYKIKGAKTNEIEAILGYCRRSAVIHRDDLVLL